MRVLLLCLVIFSAGCRSSQHHVTSKPAFKAELEVGYSHKIAPDDKVELKWRLTGGQ